MLVDRGVDVPLEEFIVVEAGEIDVEAGIGQCGNADLAGGRFPTRVYVNDPGAVEAFLTRVEGLKRTGIQREGAIERPVSWTVDVPEEPGGHRIALEVRALQGPIAAAGSGIQLAVQQGDNREGGVRKGDRIQGRFGGVSLGKRPSGDPADGLAVTIQRDRLPGPSCSEEMEARVRECLGQP